VLYVSGYASDVTAFHGLPGLAAHVLAKPFGMDSLVRRVRTILDERPARDEASASTSRVARDQGTQPERQPEA
jgi:DNA-binding response OmpR family regulator